METYLNAKEVISLSSVPVTFKDRTFMPHQVVEVQDPKLVEELALLNFKVNDRIYKRVLNERDMKRKNRLVELEDEEIRIKEKAKQEKVETERAEVKTITQGEWNDLLNELRDIKERLKNKDIKDKGGKNEG